MSFRHLIVAILVVFIFASLGASWTGIYLLSQAAEDREQIAERSDARVAEVREDISEILAEIRSPAGDTERALLFDRAVRMEHMLERLDEALAEIADIVDVD